ncbi:MAG: hypothetical protein LQ351_002597 [Letrouitia transgressa]|nr:MAG: hypothetical protein LQ351_002597 [Letrouitia transgressa]
MSPAHRKSTRAQRSSQSTLSFGGRANTSNKITKPSAPPSSSAKKQTSQLHKDEGESENVKSADIAAPDDEAAAAESIPVPESKELAQGREMAIREAKARETESGKQEDEAEERARKVSEAAVRRYWAAEEQGRKAPRGTFVLLCFLPFPDVDGIFLFSQDLSLRGWLAANFGVPVHQQALSMHEKILRHFDLSSQYGPCVGIPRVKRWKRAEALGLRPPIEVLAVLVKEREKEEGGAKNNNNNNNKKSMDTAFMDELLGGASLGS